MNLDKVTSAAEVSKELVRSAKVALACGAHVELANNRTTLMVKFRNADKYYFDPENATMHMLEALGEVRAYGFAAYRQLPVIENGEVLGIENQLTYQPQVVRIVSSATDVRVQIGASRWYADVSESITTAMRRALVTAFCDYYDSAIAPNVA
jgi:hypothetical protein